MATLAVKVANIYYAHKRRAQKDRQALDYTKEELLEAVKPFIGRVCTYCKAVLVHDGNFCVDHDKPTSRMADYRLTNLVVCCKRCNEIKGVMTGIEFKALKCFLDNIHPAAANDVLARLRAGGKRKRGL